ncbi:DUF6428 family protein [Brumimicrobium aurantiacum]|uniref:Uncharacterized protein n=1 Tax=Brumimicrobium aurantiacum TaxID=1737063 RepID=A0A3E1F1I4_9FLAO|nr:DUF6428 family protein [Brumimicrobium aurantiacum]RFC55678.1 hypothetical protein DXU93_01720 [Brumimicrobium aurantiacum]
MKLSEVKRVLKELKVIAFQLPNGELVPNHFHVTEVGGITKNFIDCGGTVRKEEVINFQLWNANDYDHRLYPDKLLNIIELSEKTLGLQDQEIEVEYQGQTIEKFALDFDGKNFLLTTKQTDCLAPDKCGPDSHRDSEEKPKVQLVDLGNNDGGTCSPGGGCC